MRVRERGKSAPTLERLPSTCEAAMRRRDLRDILAIVFVLAGVLPIVLWLGSWLSHSMNAQHIVQAVLIVVLLYVAWWIRKRLEKR